MKTTYENPIFLLNAGAEKHKGNGAGEMLKTVQRCVSLIEKSRGQLDCGNTQIAVDALHFVLNRISFEANRSRD
jgi:hypothetical protein